MPLYLIKGCTGQSGMEVKCGRREKQNWEERELRAACEDGRQIPVFGVLLGNIRATARMMELSRIGGLFWDDM